MCGRYRMLDASGVLKDVFPSEIVCVLTAEGEAPMRWGFTLPGAGKRLLINARSESAQEKSTFSPLLASQRCLIPAAAFYEWDANKQPHIFSLKNASPLYMAGLYRREKDGELHFVILTRGADQTVAPVHPRMPCIMASEEFRQLWLKNTTLSPLLLQLEPTEIIWQE